MNGSRSMRRHLLLASSALALTGGAIVLADSLVPVDRWWVGGLLGTWNDVSCWSLTDGGAAAGGLPTTDDNVHIVTDAVADSIIILYQNASDPLLYKVQLDGPGSALLNQQQDSLRTQFEIVGETGNGELQIVGGTHTVIDELILGYGAGADGRLLLQSPGLLDTTSVFIGGTGSGRFTHNGGTHDNSSFITLGSHPNLLGGGIGTYNMKGGTLDTPELNVGDEGAYGAGIGHFNQTGGVATITGTLKVGPDSDATLDVGGELRTGTTSVEGLFEQLNGIHDAGTLAVVDPLSEPGSGRYELSGGTLLTHDTSVTTTGDGGFVHTGGAHEVANELSIGAASLSGGAGEYTLSSGDLSTLLTEIANGAFHHLGGTHDTVAYVMLEGADYDLSGGELRANSLYVDVSTFLGASSFLQTAGTTTIWTTLRVERSGIGSTFSTFDLQGGTIFTSEAEVYGSFDQSGGIFTAGEFIAGTNAEVSITSNADFRAMSVLNYGTITQFGGRMAGRYLGSPFNTYQIGTFENHGEFIYLGLPAGPFLYDFINYGTLSHTVSFTAAGRIVNHGTLTAASGRNITGGGSGFGITNQGTIELFDGSIVSLYQPLSNSGRVVGAGTVEGGLTSDGLIAPGHSAGTITIEGALDLLPGSGLEIELGGYTPGTDHDEIFVVDDITLDGTLKIVTLPGFSPAPGDEFTILRSDNGIVYGEFIQVLGCSNAHIRYDLTQVVIQFDVACTASCPADTNGDGYVDILDLLDLLASWGPCPGFCAGNINGDTAVDIADLLDLLAAWGGCP